MLNYQTGVKNQPFVLEIIGASGTGKSTLSQVLSQHHKIQLDIHLSKLRCLPYILTDSLAWLPTFLQQRCFDRWFDWRESRSMAYLQAWHHILTQPDMPTDRITLFDQGPIFRLAMLREFGPTITMSSRYRQWWNKMLEQWAKTLKIIVWLDAPDSVLLDRISRRACWHTIQEQSQEEARVFLKRYRQSYRFTIDRFTEYGQPILLRFNTSQESPEQIAEQVLIQLNMMGSSNANVVSKGF